MKKILYILFLLIPCFVKAQQVTPMDSTIYATHGSGYIMARRHYLDSLRGIDSVRRNVLINANKDQTVVLTSGNGIAISGTYPNFTISVVQPTINNSPGRSLNSNFTISTTKAAIAVYSVTAQVTNPLLAGTSAGTINLEYSLNSGSTWAGALQVGNSSNVGITVTVQLVNAQTTQVIGIIPANALVRLRTTSSGTTTITYVGGQEIVY